MRISYLITKGPFVPRAVEWPLISESMFSHGKCVVMSFIDSANSGAWDLASQHQGPKTPMEGMEASSDNARLNLKYP